MKNYSKTMDGQIVRKLILSITLSVITTIIMITIMTVLTIKGVLDIEHKTIVVYLTPLFSGVITGFLNKYILKEDNATFPLFVTIGYGIIYTIITLILFANMSFTVIANPIALITGQFLMLFIGNALDTKRKRGKRNRQNW